jgi:hypothetical protein
MSVLGVRFSRHAPLLLADWDGPPIARGAPVLVDTPDGSRLALVVLAPQDFLGDPPAPPTTRIVAAGRDSPPVAEAIEARDQATLAEARVVAGPGVVVSAVRWGEDLGQLIAWADGVSGDDRAALRQRLAAHFRAAVRVRDAVECPAL